MSNTPQINRTTHLDAAPDAVWTALQNPMALLWVSYPVLTLTPVTPPDWPDRWSAGPILVSMKLGGILPIGQQTIDVSMPPPQGKTRYLRDNGSGPKITRWDHWIEIAPDGDGTRYTDRVQIEAGWRTPLVVAFARLFYAHRQRRWHRLIEQGLDHIEAPR